MRGMESDWFGPYHLEKVKKKINVSILERLDKRVRKHAILAAIHSYINLEFS